ncbi:MAG: DUF1318 domain-containing protein [Proteobacteria bacterium]|nr:DUF1318 domain-containing protein [Pseudomonadota bacterium]NDC25430.1 DUF1318 domain-containing protein [Pseudomonadota bacterium]NDD05764.1 DUF1318 domain-containing protein [Pseudomonadota bacterium]NDG27722.1 DUF1318 domain-containing protein [Pseudomonadota bacterium]
MKTFITLVALIGAFTACWGDIESMKARLPEIIDLKDKGLIGEQPDGYLGVVKDQDGAAAIVAAENADRREEYNKRAKSQGQTVEVFGKVIGGAKTRDEKSGRFVRDGAGTWLKK